MLEWLLLGSFHLNKNMRSMLEDPAGTDLQKNCSPVRRRSRASLPPYYTHRLHEHLPHVSLQTRWEHGGSEGNLNPRLYEVNWQLNCRQETPPSFILQLEHFSSARDENKHQQQQQQKKKLACDYLNPSSNDAEKRSVDKGCPCTSKNMLMQREVWSGAPQR